jgi:hypothetical protein
MRSRTYLRLFAMVKTAWHLFVDTLASFQEDQRSATVKDRFGSKAVVQTKNKNYRAKA